MRQLSILLLITFAFTRISFSFSFTNINIQTRPINVEDKGLRDLSLKSSHLVAPIYRTALVGNISYFLSTLAINRRKSKAIKTALKTEVHTVDVIALVFVSWLLKPCSKYVYQNILSKMDNFKKDYDKTLYSAIPNMLSQVSKIASLVYVIDIIDIILTELGFKFAKTYELGSLAASTFYTLWVAHRLKKLKFHLVYREKRNNINFPAYFIDRTINVFISMLCLLSLVETFQIPLTSTLKSLYAFGGAGTLIFTLASKDFATEYLSGVLSLASYKFVLGEKILLGDGVRGFVTRLGWFDMDLLCDDSKVMRIPYSQVNKQTLVNVSRNQRCQIEQTLRFQYKDIDRLDDIIEDIKLEIRASCPKLVLDGSRPFYVLIAEFNTRYVSIEVNTHHQVSPCSDEYYITRHTLLAALSRAIKKHDVSIA